MLIAQTVLWGLRSSGLRAPISRSRPPLVQTGLCPRARRSPPYVVAPPYVTLAVRTACRRRLRANTALELTALQRGGTWRFFMLRVLLLLVLALWAAAQLERWAKIKRHEHVNIIACLLLTYMR